MSTLIDNLIEDARYQTENEDVTDTTGIRDTEFIRFINEANDRIHALIVKQHNKVFLKDYVTTTSKGQESYNIPVDAHMGNMLASIEYATSTDEYSFLKPAPPMYRDSDEEGIPAFYIRRSGSVILSPKPDSARSLRMTYVQGSRRLAKRAGSVSLVTITGSTISSLFLDVVGDTIDSAALGRSNFLSVVDRNGNVKASKVEFDSINTATGEIVITSGFTLESGETLSSGDYIIPGKYASSHSELPDSVDRYLIAYCSWKIMKRDSTVDYAEQQEELLAMEQEIVDSYADLTDDLQYIPDINEDYDWD